MQEFNCFNCMLRSPFRPLKQAKDGALSQLVVFTRAHAVTQHFDEINKMYICVHFTEYSIFYLTSLGIMKTNTSVYFYFFMSAFWHSLLSVHFHYHPSYITK